MDTNSETEKLSINPEKIIHVLLKHLMVLKNENAYIKNNAALNLFENGIAEKDNGITDAWNGIAEKDNGTTNVGNGIAEKDNGITDVGNPIAEKDSGITDVGNPIAEKDNGITDVGNPIAEKGSGITDVGNPIAEKGNGITDARNGSAEKGSGITDVGNPIAEKDNGITDARNGIAEKDNGIKSVFDELSALKTGANAGDLLYRVFEKGLLNALNQYISSGNGQHSLYKYYTQFVEMVADKNADAEKMKGLTANLPLEETHFLPDQITADYTARRKIHLFLVEFFPRNAKRNFLENIANELLLLHNTGKATSAQLRQTTGLSVPGFAKHMPKMIRLGLIKKQSGFTYVLTEKSKHLLLKTFGIPKNK